MTDIEPTQKVFPFFDLPAELRNMIYDQSLDDREDQELSCHLHLKPKIVPRTNLLLVSKQMKQEYEERARKHSQLVIRDPESYNSGIEELPTLPPAASKVATIILELFIGDLEDLDIPLDDFAPLISLVTGPTFHVKGLSISIIMELDTDFDTADDWVRELKKQADWEDLPKVQSIQVYNAGQGYWNALKGKQRVAKVIAEWKKSTGKFEVLEEPRSEVLEGLPCYIERERRQAVVHLEMFDQAREVVDSQRVQRMQGLKDEVRGWNEPKVERRKSV